MAKFKPGDKVIRMRNGDNGDSQGHHFRLGEIGTVSEVSGHMIGLKETDGYGFGWYLGHAAHSYDLVEEKPSLISPEFTASVKGGTHTQLVVDSTSSFRSDLNYRLTAIRAKRNR